MYVSSPLQSPAPATLAWVTQYTRTRTVTGPVVTAQQSQASNIIMKLLIHVYRSLPRKYIYDLNCQYICVYIKQSTVTGPVVTAPQSQASPKMGRRSSSPLTTNSRKSAPFMYVVRCCMDWCSWVCAFYQAVSRVGFMCMYIGRTFENLWPG